MFFFFFPLSASQLYAAVRNRPVAVMEQAGRPTRRAGAGLELHQPLAQFRLDVLVKCRFDVPQLEGVGGHVVDLHKHLKEGGREVGAGNQSGWSFITVPPEGPVMRENFFYAICPPYLVVVEVAVLQVDRGGDGAHARIGVVVGILTHTVGKTFLRKKKKKSGTHKGRKRSVSYLCV